MNSCRNCRRARVQRKCWVRVSVKLSKMKLQKLRAHRRQVQQNRRFLKISWLQKLQRQRRELFPNGSSSASDFLLMTRINLFWYSEFVNFIHCAMHLSHYTSFHLFMSASSSTSWATWRPEWESATSTYWSRILACVHRCRNSPRTDCIRRSDDASSSRRRSRRFHWQVLWCWPRNDNLVRHEPCCLL